jgi:hypothetical protein
MVEENLPLISAFFSPIPNMGDAAFPGLSHSFSITSKEETMTLYQSFLADLGPYQLAGLIGFVLYIFSFSAVQFNWIDGNSAVFSLTNIAAASLVAISLIADFNLASALIQGSWIVIGLAGLALRLRRPVRRLSIVSTSNIGA